MEVPLSQPRHKSCAVTIDNSVVVTGGTSLGLGKFKPQFLAEIGTRRTEMFDGASWSPLPSMSRAKVKSNRCIQEKIYVEKCQRPFIKLPNITVRLIYKPIYLQFPISN